MRFFNEPPGHMIIWLIPVFRMFVPADLMIPVEIFLIYLLTTIIDKCIFHTHTLMVLT